MAQQDTALGRWLKANKIPSRIIASRCNCAVQTIRDIACGVRSPGAPMAYKIIAATDGALSLTDLIPPPPSFTQIDAATAVVGSGVVTPNPEVLR